MNFKVGRILILRGKTLRGKNRIKEFGNKWEILTIGPSGKTLLIKPITQSDAYMRWIQITNDEHFEIA